MKKIAIVGAPNVGKSSLFNRLCKQQLAITSPIKGTTRDTNQSQINISNHKAIIIDTGGIEEKPDELFSQVKRHALDAIKNADFILYLVDGKQPPNDIDKRLVRQIASQKPCFLVINKIDSDANKESGYAFSEFGIKDMFFISIIHNRGISILLNALDSALFPNIDEKNNQSEEELIYSLESMIKTIDTIDSRDSKDSKKNAKDSKTSNDKIQINPHTNTANKSDLTPQDNPEHIIRVGIIGRVNVGKSSILNALVNKERSIVSNIAGTTIDPVSEEITIKEQTIRFIDTAGIRKKGKIEGIEKFALLRTQSMLIKSDIAILVLDASEEFVELDEKICSLIKKYSLGVIVVFNKWDIKRADFKSIKAEFDRKFTFLEYAPCLTLSANNKRNIDSLKQTILDVFSRFCFRIPTAKLNESIKKAQEIHHIPSKKGKIIKIYYATQYNTKPPQIALISNYPNAIHFSYKRFLINQLRKEYDLKGVPIILTIRAKNDIPSNQNNETKEIQE